MTIGKGLHFFIKKKPRRALVVDLEKEIALFEVPSDEAFGVGDELGQSHFLVFGRIDNGEDIEVNMDFMTDVVLMNFVGVLDAADDDRRLDVGSDMEGTRFEREERFLGFVTGALWADVDVA